MSTTATLRSIADHRGMSCLELHKLVGRLQTQADKVTPLQARIDQQALTIGDLHARLDDAEAAIAVLRQEAARRQAADRLNAQLEGDLKLRDQQIADLEHRLQVGVLAEAAAAQTQEIDVSRVLAAVGAADGGSVVDLPQQREAS